MSNAKHPLGLPISYAAKLAQRHSDAGFILAQLDREYQHHDVCRDQIRAMRAKVENGDLRQRQLFLREVEIAVKAEDAQKRTAAQIVSDNAIRRALIEQEEDAREKRREIERRAQQRVRQRKHMDALKALAERDVMQQAMAPVSVPEIIACIAWALKVKPTDVVGDRRNKAFVLARRVAAWVLVKRGNSCAQVGRWLSRDHTTIMHAVKMFDKSATDEMRAVAAKYVGGE